MPESGSVRVRLVFADQGTFHAETVSVPAATVGQYARLIDLLREDESVTRELYVDLDRLVSASVIEGEG
ncbi:MAG TPA: hypothetical protein VFQ45_14820 [Longimicrobium sp.]|nr:hypothetical protein [Longimicrobium sp.]